MSPCKAINYVSKDICNKNTAFLYKHKSSAMSKSLFHLRWLWHSLGAPACFNRYEKYFGWSVNITQPSSCAGARQYNSTVRAGFWVPQIWEEAKSHVIACSRWIHLHVWDWSCSEAQLLSYLPQALFCPLALQSIWNVSCGSWPVTISHHDLQGQAVPVVSSRCNKHFCCRKP